jgi:trans-aconitate methyltransferase
MSTILENLGDRLFNKTALRPSKNALFSELIEDIREESKRHHYAADISSAHFDHAKYFKSEQYIGVDIEIERLREGKGKFTNNPKYAAVQADIRQPIFQPNSLGMIVSTHTLGHLDPQEHTTVVNMFVQYLDSGGCLLIQLTDDSPVAEIESLLRESFNCVNKFRYKNKITRIFEEWHQHGDGSYHPDMTSWRRYPNAVVILFLSLRERLVSYRPTYTYFKCTKKR